MRGNAVQAADLFCGGGGTSTGLVRAVRRKRQSVDLVAVNHWAIALNSHRANHPWAKHLFAPLEDVKPHEAVPAGRLDILVASPPCTHFSVARGGKPLDDQKRSTPKFILRWLRDLDVENILIENVPEWRKWGPLGRDGKPIKFREGEYFNRFISDIRDQGYSIDFKVLNAADYGGATRRKRLFVIGKRGEVEIPWPKQTHSEGGTVGGTLPWVAARTIIDWSLRGESIFGRELRGKRPLARNTMRRILYGIEKFNPELRPFLVVLRGTTDEQLKRSAVPLSEPVPGLSANGTHVGLAQPVLVDMLGSNLPESNSRVSDGSEPLPSPHAGGNRIGIAQPIILSGASGGAAKKASDCPIPTVTGGGVAWLADGYLEYPASAHIQTHFGERLGQVPRSHSVDDPLPSITSRAAALIQSFLIQYNGESLAHDVEQPIPAFGTHDRFGLVQPHIQHLTHGGRAHSIEDPLPTITGANRGELGLVRPVINGWMFDATFRMLQAHELAPAMGFPRWYQFIGNRTQVNRMIGNAVEVRTAEALCRTLLRGVAA